MRSNKRKEGTPAHIVTAWCREEGFGLGQKAVREKSNEITAIPELLERIQVKGQIVTIDAMGTQTAIAEKIRARQADYVLAVKRNQGSLYEDVKLYFEEEEKARLREGGGYRRTIEKARSQIEIREYYQTEEELERVEKHRNGGKDDPQGRRREKGIPLLYQQLNREYRRIQQSGTRPLEYREHALASGCDVSGRCEPDIGEAGGAESEYHPKMEPEPAENDRDIPPQYIHEEKAVCNQHESRRVFRKGTGFLKDNHGFYRRLIIHAFVVGTS